MFGREKRALDAAVTSALNTATTTAISAEEMMQDRLQRLNDEAQWERSHLGLVIAYNRSSIIFWLLLIASTCFASLNAYHGFSSSMGLGVGVAFIVGLLYSTIEFTVPTSAHLMSWGSKGQSRWAIRGVGLCAYVLGVGFSLLILQGKFSSGADSANAKQEAAATVFSSSQDQLAAAKKTAADLRGRVGSRSSASILAEMKGILAQPIAGRSTIGAATQECQGVRHNSRERDECSKYDTLRRLREDAVTYEKAVADIATLTANLSDSSRTSTRVAGAEDRVLARALGFNFEDVQSFKPSIIALMAALLTHLLWAAHGMTVNNSIAKHRDEMFERSALERSLKRVQEQKQGAATVITESFLNAKSAALKPNVPAVGVPLRELSVAAQIQRYYTERGIMGQEYSLSVGMFHDDYGAWARTNDVNPVSIERFVQITKDIGLGVSSDGRIVGAALK